MMFPMDPLTSWAFIIALVMLVLLATTALMGGAAVPDDEGEDPYADSRCPSDDPRLHDVDPVPPQRRWFRPEPADEPYDWKRSGT